MDTAGASGTVVVARLVPLRQRRHEHRTVASAKPSYERRSFHAFRYRPGGIFPDYALPDHTGAIRGFTELQGRDPMILTLARGHYCPKERSLVLNPHRTSARRMLTSSGRPLTSTSMAGVAAVSARAVRQ